MMLLFGEMCVWEIDRNQKSQDPYILGSSQDCVLHLFSSFTTQLQRLFTRFFMEDSSILDAFDIIFIRRCMRGEWKRNLSTMMDLEFP